MSSQLPSKAFGCFLWTCAVLGCGGGSSKAGTHGPLTPVACVAGASSACLCDDGQVGERICTADGATFGPCQCGEGPTDIVAVTDATIGEPDVLASPDSVVGSPDIEAPDVLESPDLFEAPDLFETPDVFEVPDMVETPDVPADVPIPVDLESGPPLPSGCSKPMLYEGHSVTLCSIVHDWASAEGVCNSWGGHLVTVDSAAETDWLASFIGGSGVVWIGYRNPGTGYGWVGLPGNGTTDFCPGEPDGVNEDNCSGTSDTVHCVGIETGEDCWADASCFCGGFFFCER